ncbi:MAG: hypothetical protein KC516_00960 [Nanoarchaeota archaeon]|nr:hypothetical protein [Nanoarchaeota archaeon]
MNKKALSAVVGTLVLIGVTMAAAALVLGFVRFFVQDKLTNSKGCLDILEKIELNEDYTCYNSSTTEGNEKVLVSLSRGEVSLDSVIITISSEYESKTFSLTDFQETISGVLPYGFSEAQTVSLPGNESGKTYVVDWPLSNYGVVQTVEIAPVIDGKACEVLEKMDTLANCF